MPRVALLLLLTLTLPLTAQPWELGESQLVPAGGPRGGLLGASSDSGHLLVWEDGRDHENGNPRRTFAARLSADGEVLDPAGISVAFGETSPRSLASDGTGYLLVGRYDLILIRADGTTSLRRDSPVAGRPVALAWNGAHYGLLFFRDDGAVVLTRLDREGNVAGGSILLADAGGGVPRLAAAGGRWMVTAGSRVAFVAPESFPAAGAMAELTLEQDGFLSFQAVTGEGSGFLAVRYDSRASRHFVETRSAAGRILETIPLPKLAGVLFAEAIVRDGEAVVIDFGMKLVRVTGASVQEIAPEGASVRDELLVLAGHDRAMTAWIDDRLTANIYQQAGTQVVAAAIDSAAWNGGGAIVSRSVWRQQKPTVAAGGGTIVAAWIETSALPSRLALQFLAADGRPLREPLYVEGAGTRNRPLVGFDGTDFLVLWSAAEGPDFSPPPPVRGVRFATDGTLLSEPFVIPNTSGHETLVSLTWNGSTWDLARPRELCRLHPDGSVAERRTMPDHVDFELRAEAIHLTPRDDRSWLGLVPVTYVPNVPAPVPQEWWLVRVHPNLDWATDRTLLGRIEDRDGLPFLAWNGEHGLVTWWNGRDVWSAVPLAADSVHRVVRAGPTLLLHAYGTTGGDAHVVATERSFLAGGGSAVALHALDGTLLAVHQLPAGAFEPRLLAQGEREALVVYTVRAYEGPGQVIDRVFAARIALQPRRRAAGK